MTDLATNIEPFSSKDATDEECDAINTFLNRLKAERTPQEPPTPLAQTAANLRNPHPLIELRTWLLWDAQRARILAHGEGQIIRTEENKHLCFCDLGVLPEYRRRGIGTHLLQRVVEFARSQDRRLLIADTADSVPAGAAFMTRLGATAAMGGRTQELKIDQVDRSLLRSWQERARERAANFELGIWEGSIPEESLDDAAALFEAANLQPRGDLEMEDFHITPAMIREMDANMVDRGLEHWTMYVRDLDTGEMAGSTDVVWNPTQPDLLDQGGTNVFQKYQNRGLGRWLKAAMLEKVLRDRPEVTRIHTSNAHSNAPMLSINDELGFKPYETGTAWQVELDKAQSYVESRLGAQVSQG